jgi:hypothetical protein
MKISNIQSMRNFLYQNSGFTATTVNNVIKALGYPLHGSGRMFNDLSMQFQNCSEHGANVGFCGFIYYDETIAFYKANRQDIVDHMENMAREIGTDIISMIQGFGVFRNSEKPTTGEIGKALWGREKSRGDFTTLYNVFSWYALEEVSRTWYRYLEENPAYWAELSA